MNMLLTAQSRSADHREMALAKLVDMLYERNDIGFGRGKFRVRGDVVEVHPANLDEEAIRIEFSAMKSTGSPDLIRLTGHAIDQLTTITIYPGKQFVTPFDKLQRAQVTIRAELDERIIWLRSRGSCSRRSGSRCAPSTTSR
jgi:excinuclease ABC subunit B